MKRVGQELGGKSANIILDDADLSKAVTEGVKLCFRNSGQSCNAPSRMMVPAARMGEAICQALKLRHDLPRAIENGDVRPYLQPLVRLGSMEIVAFEILARWRHPADGILLPGRFLRVVEEAGLHHH